MYISHTKLIYVTLLWILVLIQESKQQEGDFVTRYFKTVIQVDTTSHVDKWTKRVEGVRSKVRCASLCVEYGCECASFSYDSRNSTCHMFTKSLIGNSGSDVGANKITECSVPTVFTNATLHNYTGCNATYECDFGYRSLVPGTLTCQANETWLPSTFECLEIPCSAPSDIPNGYWDATSLQVGSDVTYICYSAYIDRGTVNTVTCVLGGTWSGPLDVLCKPINIQYTIQWTTANEDFAGTGAQVYVTVHGSYGSTTINLPLNKNYNLGTSDQYCITTEDVGPLIAVDVGHDGTGYNSGWKLDSITIIMQGVGTYIMDANVWIVDASTKATLIPSKR